MCVLLAVSPIAETSPNSERVDCISQICQQLSRGLVASSTKPQSTVTEVVVSQTGPRDMPEVVRHQPVPVTVMWGHQVETLFKENGHAAAEPGNGRKCFIEVYFSSSGGNAV